MSEPTPSDVYSAPNSGVALAPRVRRTPSRIGIASFVLGIAGVVGLVVTFGLAIVWKVVGEPTDANNAATQNLWIGLLAMASCGVALVGVCTGVVAVLQPDRARGWAAAGVIVNAFVVLVFALLVVIGLTAGE